MILVGAHFGALEVRMQHGQIYNKNGSWLLRYWDITAEGRKRKAVRLAPVSAEYPSKRSVIGLAEKYLAPINSGLVQPESSLPVAAFIEDHYLPHVKKELRPSTYVDYKNIFYGHLKKHLGSIPLRDFRTVHGQKIMRSIPGIGHTSLLRIKSFLSGVFKHAKREGFLDGLNPIVDVSVPGKPKKFKGETHSMDEIQEMIFALEQVDPQAMAVVAVAAFAGLRHAELRGLRWSDYDGLTLTIRRTVWRTHVGATKTEASEGSVPVLPELRKILDQHRARTNGQPGDYIFRGERLSRPLNLHNLTRRVIVPCLEAYTKEIQRQEQAQYDLHRQDFEVLEASPFVLKFKGFKALRRSLASNLLEAGVSPKIIQAILRHSNMSLTLEWYTQVSDEQARDALQKIAVQIAPEPK